MRRALIAVLVACKGSPAPPPAYTVDAACEAAVHQAASAPLAARPQILINSCHVCGDWKPILAWNTPAAAGGPAHTAIDQAMTACHAWCEPNARQRFLGTLDNARGTEKRTPWRMLAETCRAEFPEQRFVDGPLFALDRIARAIAPTTKLAAELAAIELPLPPRSSSGVGPVLPDVPDATGETGAIAITVLGDKVFVGRMPRAHLGAGGVALELGTGYPGAVTDVAKLPETLTAVLAGKPAPVTVLAPVAMPAQNLLPIVTAAAPIAPLYLAANAPGSPEGWSLAAAIPVQLAADGDPIAVTPEMTVRELAAAIATHKGSRVVLRSP